MSDKKRLQVDSSTSNKKRKARVLDYFRFIAPAYNNRDYWEDVWVEQILTTIQSTDVQCVYEQHRRLTIEWEERNDVWLEILAEEYRRRDEEHNLTNQMNAAMGNLDEIAVEAF
ncbi:hypothetical protein BGZ65_011036, partial [Modicella reniformis]